MQVVFKKDKSTKNTERFTATGQISGSVYIQKSDELASQNEIVLEVAETAEVSG